MEEMQKHVESLIKKADGAESDHDIASPWEKAMKYSQAALNAANAMCALKMALSKE